MDAMFYFAYGKSALAGQFLTYGNLSPVSGFHPLYYVTVLASTLIGFGNEQVPHVLIAAASVTFLAFSLYLLWKIFVSLSIARGFTIAALIGFAASFTLLPLPIPDISAHYFTALETGQSMVLMLFLLWAIIKRPHQDRLIIVATALLILARLDMAVLLVAAAAITYLWDDKHRRKMSVLIAITSVATVAIWAVLLLIFTGSYEPTTNSVKSTFPHVQVADTLQVIGDLFTSSPLSVGGNSLAVGTALALLGLIAAGASLKLPKLQERREVRILTAFSVGFAALVVWHLFFTVHTSIGDWYYATGKILVLIWLVTIGNELARPIFSNFNQSRMNFLWAGAPILIALIGILTNMNAISSSEPRHGLDAVELIVEYAEDNIGTDLRVLDRTDGMVGYDSDFVAYHLLGMAGHVEFALVRKDAQNAKDQDASNEILIDYFDTQNIDHFIGVYTTPVEGSAVADSECFSAIEDDHWETIVRVQNRYESVIVPYESYKLLLYNCPVFVN
jgi:hypothetical protein